MDAKFLPLLGRILLSSLFIQAGIRKIVGIGATATTISNHGLPFADALAWCAVVMELGAGGLLVIGLWARWAALALCLYALMLALVFHNFWNAAGAAFGTQRTEFFNHLEIMGGMLYVIAFGAGQFSLDALIWRRPMRLAPAE